MDELLLVEGVDHQHGVVVGNIDIVTFESMTIKELLHDTGGNWESICLLLHKFYS
jgi:hypothetical protein